MAWEEEEQRKSKNKAIKKKILVMREKRAIREWAGMDLTTHKTWGLLVE